MYRLAFLFGGAAVVETLKRVWHDFRDRFLYMRPQHSTSSFGTWKKSYDPIQNFDFVPAFFNFHGDSIGWDLGKTYELSAGASGWSRGRHAV